MNRITSDSLTGDENGSRILARWLGLSGRHLRIVINISVHRMAVKTTEFNLFAAQ
jgi:hypothetical protein